MDFEELEDVCEDNDLDIDPDDYDEEEVENSVRMLPRNWA